MPGHFMAMKMGIAQILATAGDIDASSRVNVAAAKLMSLELIPESKAIGNGGSVRVAVIATYSDDTRETVTKDVNWATTNASVLLPSSTDVGYLVAFGEGSASVTATLGDKTITGSYMVTPPKIDYLVISPQNARIDATHPVQFSAMGHWTDGRYVDVTAMVAWSSSDTAIATVDANGFATASGDGAVTISGTIGDVTSISVARTVTSGCPYPDGASAEVAYDSILPPLFWVDAMDEKGTATNFEASDIYCDAVTHPTILFVVTAGWCPYCPAYMAMVDSISADLEAAGTKIVYVVIETDSGDPASNAQADMIVSREIPGAGHSVRVGDRDTAGGANLAFGRAVSALPSAFFVRTSDMRVIADQNRSETYLDLINIAQNPNRLY
jgi:thiol-disulfide isomerase/thioredoxin